MGLETPFPRTPLLELPPIGAALGVEPNKEDRDSTGFGVAEAVFSSPPREDEVVCFFLEES